VLLAYTLDHNAKGEGGAPIPLDFETSTPKAFANSSPGFERSENPGIQVIKAIKPWKG